MDLKSYFKQNQSKLDVYEPKMDHKQRFLEKLNKNQVKKKTGFSYRKWAIAATILLFGFLTFQFYVQYQQQADSMKEVRQNEQYFSALIQAEIDSLEVQKTEETERVFKDAITQIQMLETDYKKLVNDYSINKDRNILNAMIQNFRQRIEILEFVKQQMQQIKQTKNAQNEKYKA